MRTYAALTKGARCRQKLILPCDCPHRCCHAVLFELIGEPIQQSAKLIREPIKGRVKTGTPHSTGAMAAGDCRGMRRPSAGLPPQLQLL